MPGIQIILSLSSASGVSYLQAVGLYKKQVLQLKKPILPPSSKQNVHSLPFLRHNLKSPSPSQAVKLGLCLSNSVCKIKKVIAWRGGAGPKSQDTSNLNSSMYKLSWIF